MTAEVRKRRYGRPQAAHPSPAEAGARIYAGDAHSRAKAGGPRAAAHQAEAPNWLGPQSGGPGERHGRQMGGRGVVSTPGDAGE